MWRFLVVAFAVTVGSCAAAPAAKVPADPAKQLLFTPNCHKCDGVLSVSRDYGTGKLTVFINPLHVYQYASSLSPIYGSEFVMETRQWEIFSEIKPGHIATHAGWKTPESVHNYVFVVFDALPDTKDSRPMWIVVRWNGQSAWLVTIRQAQPPPMVVEKTVLDTKNALAAHR